MDDATRLADQTTYRLVANDRGTLLVVFAHRDADGFAFSHVTDHLNCSRLFVRDPSLRGWYNSGVPGLGSTVSEIATSLAMIVATGGYGRVLTLGSSMGGYAAVLFGALLKATSVLAFNPQILLDRVFPLSPPNDMRIEIEDLRPLVLDAPSTRFNIVVSEDDAVDLCHLAHVSTLPNVHPWTVFGSSHLISEELGRRGELRPLLTQWLSDDVIEVLEHLPLLKDPGQAERLERGIYAFMAGRFDAALPDLELIGQAYRRHPGLSHFTGLAAVEAGRRELAVASLRNALGFRPHWSETERLLRRALRLQH